MLIDKTLKTIRPIDGSFKNMAKARLDSLTKPQGSLGVLEDLAMVLCAIYGSTCIGVAKKAVFVFAADHGVAAEGVSLYPKEVTGQMVLNFLAGGAAINVLAKHAGAGVNVVDVGVDCEFGEIDGLIQRKVMAGGTKNITKGPAMEKHEAIQSMEIGIELAIEYEQKGYKMFAVGEMGIANTTSAAAIVSAITGMSPEDVTGRGTGVGDEGLKKKTEAIKQAIAVNKPESKKPLDVLMKLGGLEIGAMAGLCLGGALKKVPVIVDGFISSTGALIACCLNPHVKDYLIFAHKSKEIGHSAIFSHINAVPLIDFSLRLGEGTGAALCMPLIDGAIKLYSEMATFKTAGVSEAST